MTRNNKNGKHRFDICHRQHKITNLIPQINFPTCVFSGIHLHLVITPETKIGRCRSDWFCGCSPKNQFNMHLACSFLFNAFKRSDLLTCRIPSIWRRAPQITSRTIGGSLKGNVPQIKLFAN